MGVYFGGANGAGSALGTWDFDGTTWKRTLVPEPRLRSGHTMSYDVARSQTVLFGGFQGTFLDDTWRFSAVAVDVAEACMVALDYDQDGAIGCADDECWGVCAPQCAPDTPMALCPASPRCGDAVCTSTLENCRNCAGDCPIGDAMCPIVCGDGYCDAPNETLAACPGDCTS